MEFLAPCPVRNMWYQFDFHLPTHGIASVLFGGHVLSVPQGKEEYKEAALEFAQPGPFPKDGVFILCVFFSQINLAVFFGVVGIFFSQKPGGSFCLEIEKGCLMAIHLGLALTD